MTGKRAGSAAWVVTAVLIGALTAGCGGDPEPKGDATPSPSGSSAGSSESSPATPESTFPPDVPVADGPWIPSVTLKLKVPKGFKGDATMGVTTLTAPDSSLTVMITDFSSLSDSTAKGLAAKNSDAFDAKPKTTYSTETVDGQPVDMFVQTGKASVLDQVAYGFVVEGQDGNPNSVIVTFLSQGPTAKFQDTIDSVLASITWSKKVVG